MSDQSVPAAEPRERKKLHVRASLAFVRSLRFLLYALLALSVAFSLFVSTAQGGVHPALLVLAPAAFGVFLVLFAVYRVALVSQRRYSLRKAFVQIALGAVLWVLLLPGHRLGFSSETGGDDLPALARSLDPRVRALSVEAARARPAASRYADLLVERLDDPDARVRAEAARSLRTIFGFDAAPGADGPAAQEKWRAWLAARRAGGR